LALKSIPTGNTSVTFEVDFKQDGQAILACSLLSGNQPLGIVDQVICQENVDLQLVSVAYNPVDNTIHYQVKNNSKFATPQHVYLKYNATAGATLDGKQNFMMDLGPIAPDAPATGNLVVNLGTLLQAQFDFQVHYNKTDIGIKESVDCKIDLEMTQPTLNKANNQVTFQVKNKGNVNISSPIHISYHNIHQPSNKASITASTPTINSLKAGEEVAISAGLNFNNEGVATFEFQADYAGHLINQTCTFKDIQLYLKVYYESYTGKIHYTIRNQGSGVAENLVLKFENTEKTKPENTVALKLDTNKSATQQETSGEIKIGRLAGKSEEKGKLKVYFKQASAAQFQFDLYQGKELEISQLAICKVPPKLRFKKNNFSVSTQTFSLEMSNNTGLTLTKGDLEKIYVTYTVNKVGSATLHRDNLKKLDLQNLKLSELLSTSSLSNAGSGELNL
ncbi:MAG: hypothetical protein ACK4M7_08675, partial [Burkholderiales bacterium]